MAATPKGVRAVVLPKFSRRTVENVLVHRLGSTFDVRRSSRATENKKSSSFPEEPRTSNSELVLREAHRQVIEFLQGGRRNLDFPVDLSGGSPFQRRVWRASRRIPYGRVRSYKWIAAKVGGTKFARAVGHALGANPVPIVVPCHRVVAHDGSLGGFSGGLRIKRRLLELEGTLPLLCRKRQ